MNSNFPSNLTRSIAGLLFLENDSINEGAAHLLVITFSGELHKYLVNRNGQYQLVHSFNFTFHHQQGVTAVVYIPIHSLLIIGSHVPTATGLDNSMLEAEQHGLSLWRILSSFPFYKLITDYEEDIKKSKQRGFLKRFMVLPKLSWQTSKDSIFKMSLSPNQKQLATLHYSGKLVLWDVPSLHKRKSWTHEQQPCHDELNPEFLDKPQKRKLIKDLVQSKNLLDVNWWTDNALILARCQGSVSLASTKSLKNMLGETPEWFEPAPRVTSTFDGRFLGLECACKFVTKHSLGNTSSNNPLSDDQFEDSDDEEISWMRKTSQYTKQVLYYITDNECFKPMHKKPRFVNRTYQLVCLRSTTPEELYAQKIDNEEYGEALALAMAYNLDCDLVYQRQWHKSPVSVASINDYLRKISKRSWVLHECLERVPDSIHALKDLLKYGLKGTDLQAMIAIAKKEDGGRFVICDDDELIIDSDDEYEGIDFFNMANLQKQQEKIFKKKQELLDQIKFASLSLEQKELCRARLKLLQYLDRLMTYELILGGIHSAPEHFDRVFFETFRSENLVEAAVKFAQDSETVAVEALFSYHGTDVLPHRLAILSNFPETTSPSEYSHLLPEVGLGNMLLPWEEDQRREEDWCEAHRSVIDPIQVDLGINLYEENPSLLKFKGISLDKEVVKNWYMERACEIERESRMVDNAVELIKLSIDRGVEGLEDLLDDLITMECLVYDCHVGSELTFKQLQEKNNIEKVHLIMNKSSIEKYVKNIHHWLIPFLKRCERNDPHAYMTLLKNYMTNMAKDDLTLPLKIFEASKSNLSTPVIANPLDLIQMAIDVIYICERDNQVDIAGNIMKCLPLKIPGAGSYTQELQRQRENLESHIWAAQIFNEYGLQQTIYTIKDSQKNIESTKNLLVKLTRSAGRRTPAMNEKEWFDFHRSVTKLQERLFQNITPAEALEIYVASMLCSSDIKVINLAKHYITQQQNEPKFLQHVDITVKVSFEQSVHLVLNAAQEYFNSASNFSHFSMNMAKTCLNLIKDSSEDIQKELDLIESLSILEEFGVSILPLQVRLKENRLDLVKESINSRTNAYRQSDKLLQLAKFLHASENEAEIDGNVHQLIAEMALVAKDYMCAYSACSQLMRTGYAPAWSVCMDLAEKGNCVLGTRIELMEFAVTYCTADMIEPILQAKALLEIQLLYDQVNAEFGNCPPFLEKGCHPFYIEVIENSISDKKIADLEKFECQLPHSIETSSSILRTAKLEESLTEGEQYRPTTEVLLRLALATLRTDLTLGLSYLLALPQCELADQCFSQLPNTALALQLAEFYYSLNIYLALWPDTGPAPAKMFNYPPSHIISTVAMYLVENPDLPEVQKSVERLQNYCGLSKDYCQAKTLQGLGRGVDVLRFTEDDNYKHETILGLAMTNEADIFKIAVSLAEHYNLSQWELYMTHLEFLFCESGLDANVLTLCVQEAKLMPTLLENPKQFVQRMKDYVYPFIEGHNHSRLICYYSLLVKCEEYWLDEKIKPSLHVGLLKKLRPVAPGLDYKILMSGKDTLFNVIQPILNENNVNVFAKLAFKIPDQKGGYFHSGIVFAMWAAKMFWNAEINQPKLTGDSCWLHQYDDCWEFTQKMFPADLLMFIESIVFVSTSREKLSTNCRENIVKRALKYCQQDKGKKKKQDGSSCDVTWKNAEDKLQIYLQHLRSLQNPIIEKLKSSEAESMQHYAEMYDLSKGDVELLKKFHIQLLLDGLPIDLLNDILSIKPISNWNLSTAVKKAIEYCTDYILDSSKHCDIFKKSDGIDVVESIIQNVLGHQEMSGKLVTADDLLSLLLPFCSNCSVSVQPRLKLLKCLEMNFKLKPKDIELVVFYRTNAVIADSWPHQQLESSDIQTVDARQKLFENLLSASSTDVHYVALCQLLKIWPSLEMLKLGNPAENPWVKMITTMSPDAICQVLKEIPEETPLSKECVSFIVDNLLSKKHMVSAVKTALMSSYKDLQKDIIKQLHLQKKAALDTELYWLILRNQLMAITVGSCYYEPLVNFILDQQEAFRDSLVPDYLDVDVISQDLIAEGFEAEAGTLQLKAHGTQPMLQTFSAALGVCKHWLKL
ncbi:NBAS [Acanthosepion pharaonis]|uniref:NBAS n=1 Tax=Acanthosepion pharaonis TaxID=158019 RepID=A0A812BPJ6_ACAPH|nr:NBAS [Sepia pharaonis]